MLSDFFRINLPYGMVRDENDKWTLFNREGKPIGFNTDEPVKGLHKLPIANRYWGLSDRFIMELTGYDETSIRRDEKGDIRQFWLYNDAGNPINRPSKDNEYWAVYWKKLEALARLGLMFSFP